MKKFIFIFTILFALNASAADLTYVPDVEYIPLHKKVLNKIQECTWHLGCYFEKKLGASITYLSGSDLVSDIDTIVNAALLSLNVNKFDVASTSHSNLTTASALVTVGTLTSGAIGSGFTTLTAGIGGTGTTSPTSKQIMIGNGSSGFQVIGFGSSGQFLTSGGDATLPNWSTASFNEAGSYNFTGTNLFKNFNASSTAANPITLNGLSYNTPAGRAASSTSLMEDGAGNLTWNVPPWGLIASSTLSAATASTTLSSIPFRRHLKVVIYVPSVSVNGTGFKLQFNSDTSANYVFGDTYLLASGGGTTDISVGVNKNIFLLGNDAFAGTPTGMYTSLEIINNPTTDKVITGTATFNFGDDSSLVTATIGGAWDNSAAAISSITLGAPSSGTLGIGTNIAVYGAD